MLSSHLLRREGRGRAQLTRKKEIKVVYLVKLLTKPLKLLTPQTHCIGLLALGPEAQLPPAWAPPAGTVFWVFLHFSC